MPQISLTFDGGIAPESQIALRNLGRSLTHLQSAIDRAYLDVKRGDVWKHTRLSNEDYPNTVFMVGNPREGSYIVDFLSNTAWGGRIVDRISTALSPIHEMITAGGLEEVESIADQVDHRKIQLENNLIEPRSAADILDNPQLLMARRYGDKSILKEIGQILSPLASDHTPGGSIKISLQNRNTQEYEYTPALSRRFINKINEKTLAEPFLYTGKIVQIDSDILKGRFNSSHSSKKCVIHFRDIDDLMTVSPYFNRDDISFYASPIVEYGTYDPHRGDIFFISLNRPHHE